MTTKLGQCRSRHHASSNGFEQNSGREYSVTDVLARPGDTERNLKIWFETPQIEFSIPSIHLSEAGWEFPV